MDKGDPLMEADTDRKREADRQSPPGDAASNGEEPSSKRHKRRTSGLLLRFTDLPSWNEEETKRREEERRKELAAREALENGQHTSPYVRVPPLQELSARVTAAFMTAPQVPDIPEVLIDLVRPHMDKNAQISILGNFKDFYEQQPYLLSSSSSSLSSSSSSSASSSSLSSPLRQQRPKSMLVRTVQSYGRRGQLDGESRWYFRNGQMECQEFYQLDQLHGPARTWFESGQMEAEREWNEGLLHGQIKEWYPTGGLKTHEVWRAGVREKVIVADGRKLTDRTRDFLFGSRLRANVGAGNGRQGPNSGGGLDWLSLDGVPGRLRNPWRG